MRAGDVEGNDHARHGAPGRTPSAQDSGPPPARPHPRAEIPASIGAARLAAGPERSTSRSSFSTAKSGRETSTLPGSLSPVAREEFEIALSDGKGTGLGYLLVFAARSRFRQALAEVEMVGRNILVRFVDVRRRFRGRGPRALSRAVSRARRLTTVDRKLRRRGQTSLRREPQQGERGIQARHRQHVLHYFGVIPSSWHPRAG
jgi:GNAT superfamily N-acetyltransferase